jgi:hypothetical protein
VTAVLASAFRAGDWWEEPVERDPVDPSCWSKGLDVHIPSSDPHQPVVLRLTANDESPRPLVDVETSEHTEEDLAALAGALPHIVDVIHQIATEEHPS